MRRKLISFLSLLLISSQPALAEEVVMKTIPSAEIVGVGRLSILFWDVYDATLYAPGGQCEKGKPFALSIHYFHEINGKDIADRSIEEMRGQGFEDEDMLRKWHVEMNAIFPDVQNGTVLTAVFTPGKHTEFFENGRKIGTVKGDDFLHRFSGIWLSENTSEPALRKKLLGQSNGNQS